MKNKYLVKFEVCSSFYASVIRTITIKAKSDEKAVAKAKKQINYYNKSSSDYYRLDSVWLEDKAIYIEGGNSQCY